MAWGTGFGLHVVHGYPHTHHIRAHTKAWQRRHDKMRHRSSLLPPEVDSPLDASVFEGLYRHYLGRHLDRFTDADDLGRAFVEDAQKTKQRMHAGDSFDVNLDHTQRRIDKHQIAGQNFDPIDQSLSLVYRCSWLHIIISNPLWIAFYPQPCFPVNKQINLQQGSMDWIHDTVFVLIAGGKSYIVNTEVWVSYYVP